MKQEIVSAKKKTPRRLRGVVVSHAMNKTAVVLVSRYVKHPKYKKYIQWRKKYKAHDEANSRAVGETVTIEECRPISKEKHFKIV